MTHGQTLKFNGVRELMDDTMGTADPLHGTLHSGFKFLLGGGGGVDGENVQTS